MFRSLLLAAGLLACGFAQAVGGFQPGAEERRQQAATMRLLQGFLANKQYALRARPLGEVVEPAFQAWLEALDPTHRYFTDEDLDALRGARAGFREALEGKDLAPVFQVFERYAAQVEAHASFVETQLAGPGEPNPPGDDAAAGPAPGRAPDRVALETRWHRWLHDEWRELRSAGLSSEQARRALLARHAGQASHVRRMSSGDVFAIFANAFTVAVDPHGSYLPPFEPADGPEAAAGQVGVGLVVAQGLPFPVVQGVVPGGPADRAGVRVGEQILAIADAAGEWTESAGLRLDVLVAAMRGAPGTPLSLRLRSGDGEVRQAKLARAAIEPVALAATGSVRTVGGQRIGVITLPSFYADFAAERRGDPDARSAAADVARLLAELEAQGVDGVLLDLRGNGGGALRQAVEVAALFLGKRPVVQVRETAGRVHVDASETAAAWDGPLAVLVDRDTAAAAEIVAAALQDHGRARVLGERSFGRGTVQQLIDLGRTSGEPRGYLKFTVAEFFRVDGRAVDGVGIEPDLSLPVAQVRAPLSPAAAAMAQLPPVQGFEAAAALVPDEALETAARRVFEGAGDPD